MLFWLLAVEQSGQAFEYPNAYDLSYYKREPSDCQPMQVHVIMVLPTEGFNHIATQAIELLHEPFLSNMCIVTGLAY